MEPTPKLKYFVYLRKSTDDSEKQVLSLDTQRDKALEMFGNLEIVEIYEEKDSAYVPDNRPVFAKMMKRIEKGHANGIIAWHPDRLSRNEMDAAKITYMIRQGFIQDLKFGSYHFDNSPEGIMMLQLSLSQSQYSSAKLSKDVKRGLEKKLRMGWKPCVAPAGYLNNKIKDKGERDIINDPDRFETIKECWKLMLTGYYTPRMTSDMINARGYLSIQRKRLGGKPLSYSGMYAIFSNIFYAGLIEHNGKLYQGNHEPMVTIEEFDRVQELLGRKDRPRSNTHQFAFTGCINCGECHCMVTAETKTKYIQSTQKIRSYTYYHCTRKKRGINCTQRKMLREDMLEVQIKRLIKGVTILPEFFEWALEGLKEQNDLEVNDRSQVYEQQHQAFVAKQKQLDDLNRSRYQGIITDDEFYDREKNTLQRDIAQYKQLLRDTEARAERWQEISEKIFQYCLHGYRSFLLGDLQKKKEILTALGTKLELIDGQLRFETYKWLVPIQESYPELEKKYTEEYQRLELENSLEMHPVTGIKYAKSAALTALRTQWLRRLDSNQQPSG